MEFSQEAVRAAPDIGISAFPLIETAPRVRHIALIGNHLPRRCGIATYTSDVAKAMAARFPEVQVDIWVMNDGKSYDYPDHLAGIIEQDDVESYLTAARQITASGADMVWIQHEFGIFGGKAGEHILALIERITVPVAVALHIRLVRCCSTKTIRQKSLAARRSRSCLQRMRIVRAMCPMSSIAAAGCAWAKISSCLMGWRIARSLSLLWQLRICWRQCDLQSAPRRPHHARPRHGLPSGR